MIDLGQWKDTVNRLPQTGFLEDGALPLIHKQLRSSASPLLRQLSQFHADGEENWKWNAIRSFFFLPQTARVQIGPEQSSRC